MNGALRLALPVVLAAACGGEPPPPPLVVRPALLPPEPVATTPPPPATPPPLRRSVLFAQQPFGSSLETTAPDGTVTIAYDVHQNGRGPHCDASRASRCRRDARLARGARPPRCSASRSTRRSPSRAATPAGRAPRRPASARSPPPPSSCPSRSAPSSGACSREALLQAGGTLALLPAGEAHLEKEGELTVHAGEQARHLTVYAMTGLRVAPIHAWLDDDHRWFGFADPSSAIVPEGWGSIVPALLQEQTRLEREADRRAAQAPRAHPAGRGARVHPRARARRRARTLAEGPDGGRRGRDHPGRGPRPHDEGPRGRARRWTSRARPSCRGSGTCTRTSSSATACSTWPRG